MMSLKKNPDDQERDLFSIRLAIVRVLPSESNEEAWRRHLLQHPQDSKADVKIFHRGGNTSSQN